MVAHIDEIILVTCAAKRKRTDAPLPQIGTVSFPTSALAASLAVSASSIIVLWLRVTGSCAALTASAILLVCGESPRAMADTRCKRIKSHESVNAETARIGIFRLPEKSLGRRLLIASEHFGGRSSSIDLCGSNASDPPPKLEECFQRRPLLKTTALLFGLVSTDNAVIHPATRSSLR